MLLKQNNNIIICCIENIIKKVSKKSEGLRLNVGDYASALGEECLGF